jgi:hypothetical protein
MHSPCQLAPIPTYCQTSGGVLKRASGFFLLAIILPMSNLQQEYRIERDTFGELKVPADRYYGAQTQRYVLVLLGATWLFLNVIGPVPFKTSTLAANMSGCRSR